MAESVDNSQADDIERLSSVFLQMDFERVKAVVTCALEFKSQASESARGSLEAAIRRSVRMDGFRDASRAPLQQVTEPVMWAIHKERDDRLAGAVLRAWAESHSGLHDVVVERLGSLGIPAEYPDLKASRFISEWYWVDWLTQRDAIIEDHADFDEDDIGLMLCYVSGRIPDPPHIPNEDELGMESPLLSRWLGELRELPPDAPEWAAMHDFVAALAVVAAEKDVARIVGQVKDLDRAISDIVEAFGDELRYLDIDIGSWSDEAVERPTIASDALELVEELEAKLVEYRPIRPQASSRGDELRRAEERRECEETILGLAAGWARLMESAGPPDDEPPPPEETDEPAEEADDDGPAAAPVSTMDEGAATHPAAAMAEYDELRAELDRLKGEGEAHKAENARLGQENAGLQSDKALLGDEISGLRNELSLSRESEESWRRAYVSAKQADPAEDEPAPILSVDDAVAQAKRTFPGELLVCLNSKSDKASPFQKPEELFNALAWLATEYHSRRSNPGASPDFNMLVKTACPGWFYKPDQAGVTKDQFAKWYTATADGKEYELNSHIGKGNSFDPQVTVRVAFAWDDELRKVIIGYIGRHQRNRRS